MRGLQDTAAARAPQPKPHTRTRGRARTRAQTGAAGRENTRGCGRPSRSAWSQVANLIVQRQRPACIGGDRRSLAHCHSGLRARHDGGLHSVGTAVTSLVRCCRVSSLHRREKSELVHCTYEYPGTALVTWRESTKVKACVESVGAARD